MQRSGDIESTTAPDGYELSFRRWRPAGNTDHQLILLHGIVSHSEWLSPIAAELADAGVDVVCPDRRGTGLSIDAPGDAPDVATLVDDIAAINNAVNEPDTPAHLGGFCWGGTYALNCLEKDPAYDSFVLVAPSIFPAADIGEAELITGDSGEATLDPHVPIDRFTSGPAFDDYITPDPLRTRKVSPRFNRVLLDMNRLIAPRWAKLKIPTLMILASDDRLSDNDKHDRAFRAIRGQPKRKKMIPGEHGLSFDAPTETAAAIHQWLSNFDANDESPTLIEQRKDQR